MKDVIKAEILKLLDVGMIYPIADSEWVSPAQVVPKKSGITIVENKNNELIPTRKVTGWRVCIDYRKLNSVSRKDHFSLPFIDEILSGLQVISSIAFSTDTQATIKWKLLEKIRKRRLLHARMEPLPTEECPLGYAMHQRHSNISC
ncbi:uncharacterized protein LOC113315610 [Papaver somniferum]|uniref:uncharacterized protein LOC113315610 n=1 Tax=Papaver somniferum TaxID=3469 RepID=UPI000E6F9529|nr:uncharacterized protein LOC113315610 [Papaver somniferum]